MLTKTTWIAALGVLAGGGVAVADDFGSAEAPMAEQRSMYSYAWTEPKMYTQIGVGITLGGGITGFTDQAVRDVTGTRVGGLWGARATIGTHIPIGLDLAYNGTAVDIKPLGTTGTATLVGTNVEGALRYNILPHYAFNPYIFGGVGWQRFDMRNSNLTSADTSLSTKDTVAVYPMGAGVAYRTTKGFVADVRGTFRLAQGSALVRQSDGAAADLHSWDAGGNLGYEF